MSYSENRSVERKSTFQRAADKLFAIAADFCMRFFLVLSFGLSLRWTSALLIQVLRKIALRL